MKYEIFEVCYKEEHIKNVDPLFTMYDNLKNEQPQLREYPIFLEAFDSEKTKDLDAWGFVGPSWRKKLRFDAKELIDNIEKDLDFDVYIFNHSRVNDAMWYNVWEQGEACHPGISKIAKSLLKISGYNSDIVDTMMYEGITGYCSYFVATKDFWKEYLNFLKEIYDSVEKLSDEEKEIFYMSANYSKDKSLNMFPFIVERMFTTFLLLKNKFAIRSKEYDFDVYSKDANEWVPAFIGLNNLKKIVVRDQSKEIFRQWQLIRSTLFQLNPNITNLD